MEVVEIGITSFELWGVDFVGASEENKHPHDSVGNWLWDDGGCILWDDGGAILLDAEEVNVYYDICPHIGYITADGLKNTSDPNWIYSDYIPIESPIKITYRILGHNLVSSITFYDKDKNVISTLLADGQDKEIAGVVSSPDGSAWVRISGGSKALNERRGFVPYLTINKR